jgi:hypothetical protein
MGRLKKPLNQISESALRNHPGRYRGRIAAPRAKGRLGAPPKWMDERQRVAWKEIEKQAPQLLGWSDRSFVEIAAVLRAKLSAGTISSGETSVLVATLKQLGFATVDRTDRESAKAKSILDVLSLRGEE